jgi:hypothetical protein
MLCVHCNVHFTAHLNARSWNLLQLCAILYYIHVQWQILDYAMYYFGTLFIHGIHSPSHSDVRMCFECRFNPMLRM